MKISILLSIPKTLLFNLLHLPLRQALKVPIWIHCRAKTNVRGKVTIENSIHTAMIRIGFHTCPECNPADETRLSISTGGVLRFDGTAHIGRGSKIIVATNALMELGDNFAISASSTIVSYTSVY